MARKFRLSRVASALRRDGQFRESRLGAAAAASKLLLQRAQPTVFAPTLLRVAGSAPTWAARASSIEEHLHAHDGTWFHSFAFDNGAATSGRDPSDLDPRVIC